MRELPLDEVEKRLKSILRIAEIVQEHLMALSSRNHMMTLGIDGIIDLTKEAIELIEKMERA